MVFLRATRSISAALRLSLALSCRQHWLIACLTAFLMGGESSPMYSLLVPLKGILVLTIEQKTPILSCVGEIEMDRWTEMHVAKEFGRKPTPYSYLRR